MNRSLLLLFLLSILTASCGGRTDEAAAETVAEPAVGSLAIVANGEDFVRQGFVSKDGWRIDFEHVYVTLLDIGAYQTDPPYDASTGDQPNGEKVAVAGPLTVDLAAGDAAAEPILVDTVEAAAGRYNALGWQMAPATEGVAAGSTILMAGTAQNGDQTIDFTIRDAAQYTYYCGEFVGDVRKGFVQAETTADIEATFHFDHIFGDAETPAEEKINVDALGFKPLAALANGNQIDTTVAELENLLDAEAYDALTVALSNLGHVGEGHCYSITSN